MHAQEWYLYKPEDEERDHGIRSNALGLWDMVLEGQEGGPDSADHDTDGIRTIHGLDGEPEDGEDGAGDNGDVGAPEAPRGAGKDREGCMVCGCQLDSWIVWTGRRTNHTGSAVQCDNEGYDEKGESDNAERFTPCETWRT
jgi:hypothetical protein